MDEIAASKALPQQAPATNPSSPPSLFVFQTLSPTTLPSSSHLVSEEAAKQDQEQKAASEQEESLAEATLAQQQWQAHRDAELQEAHLKIRVLEAQQALRLRPTYPEDTH